MRPWFSGRTRACQARDRVSITLGRTKCDSKTTLQVCTNLCILGIKDRGLLRESVKY